MSLLTIDLPIRWCPTIPAPEEEAVEINNRYVEKVWPLPAEQTALVMVDCWDVHPIRSHEANSARLCEEVIRPAVDACHRVGVTVIHAPSPAQATAFPQWIQYAGDRELGVNQPAAAAPAWPPADFRQRTGDYLTYARPYYLRPVMDSIKDRTIVPVLTPAENEYVIATGDQLHRLCCHRRILHLLYCGFAANMCVPFRDYGIKAMHERGYSCILLRDATLAIEAAHTYQEKRLTEAAWLAVEMLWGVSSTAEHFLAACARSGA